MNTARPISVKLSLTLLTTLLIAALAVVHANEPAPLRPTSAFPGAEGHGAYGKGGRGGHVVRVTTLNKGGPGSLAWAINEVKEPRTIVFDVSGVIDCNNEIAFAITPENDRVTVAGETSPHGVAVYNYRRFDISGEEVIKRFMRFRGTRIHTKNDPDGLLILDAKNVIADHCSFAGAYNSPPTASLPASIIIPLSASPVLRRLEIQNPIRLINCCKRSRGRLCSMNHWLESCRLPQL